MTEQTAPDSPQHTKEGILHKSLSEVLQNNPQAQNLIIKSMGISQEQLQKMLTQTAANPLMHMPISELFTTGFVQQSVQANKVSLMQKIKSWFK